jgi:peptide/nickel transport system substrate-binding protein
LVRSERERTGISRTVTVVVIVVILVLAVGAAAYLATRPSTTTTTTTTTTSSSPTTSIVSTSTTSTPSSTTSSTSSSSSSGGSVSTLTVDDVFCCAFAQFNQIGLPYPQWLTYSVYQPLIYLNGTAEYNNDVYQILPGLAVNYTLSNDNSTYTFNLQKNISFSNGDPFNAYQVWGQMYFTYYMAANSSLWYFGYPLFNDSAVNFGPSTLALMESSGVVNPSAQLLSIMENQSWPVYVTGQYQVVFHMNHAFPWFLDSFTEAYGLMYDVQEVLQHGGPGVPGTPNSYFNEDPIAGTGPYTVAEVAANSFVRLVQNPSYWGDSLSAATIQGNEYLSPGHAATVIIQAKTDDIARYDDLNSGAAQISAVEATNWNLVMANPTKYGELILPPWANLLAGMGMNTQKWPTNSSEFRLGVANAINDSQIIQEVFFGHAYPDVGPEYPGWTQYYDIGGYAPPAYNVTLAQQEISQAVGNKTVPTLQFAMLASCTTCLEVGQIVQSDLAAVGITVEIEALSTAAFGPPYMVGFGGYVYDSTIAQQAANFVWMGDNTFAPDILTPADEWTTFVSCTSIANDFAVYCNPIVQQGIDAWFNGSSPTVLHNALAAAQKQIVADEPEYYFGILGLWFGGGSVAWDKSTVSSFLMEPLWSGFDSAPIVNTVQFVSNAGGASSPASPNAEASSPLALLALFCFAGTVTALDGKDKE